MKKYLKILILPIAIIIMLGGFTGVAFAQPAPLVVQFTPNPLFDKPNFLPEDVTSGEVMVTNHSGDGQTILTEAINIFDADDFGNLLHITIKNGDETLFDNSLHNFFTDGEIPLGTISNEESKTFTYTISFTNSSDNSYQGKTLGFDICVGFEGGQTNCGDTVIGGDEDTGGGTGGDPGGAILPGTGGGGGGGPITQTLRIFNERSSEVTEGSTVVLPTATALITWNTNLLATSQVVYGPNTSTYTFDINDLPAFGYPLYTPEDTTKVIFHSMLLTNLTPGQTYVYRVVSRASPPTISYEHQFTVPLLAQGGDTVVSPNQNIVGGGVQSSPQGEDLGVVAGEASTSPESQSLNNNLALAVASGFEGFLSICTLIALIVLLIIYLVWRFWLKGKYEKDGIPKEQIKTRFFIYFGLASVLATIVSLILGNYCPIPVFLGSAIICLCMYLYRLTFKIL